MKNHNLVMLNINESKKTALEQLKCKIKNELEKDRGINSYAHGYAQCLIDIGNEINKLKPVEKEIIKDAYWNGSDGMRTKTEILNEAEEFYNDTYEGEYE